MGKVFDTLPKIMVSFQYDNFYGKYGLKSTQYGFQMSIND